MMRPEPVEGRELAVHVAGVRRVFPSRRGTDVVALENVDLDVGAKEFVSLIGPSGCGKSTLLRLIADLDSPTEGTCEVFGRLARQARQDQAYGIAFQQAGLLPWRTVTASSWPLRSLPRNANRSSACSVSKWTSS